MPKQKKKLLIEIIIFLILWYFASATGFAFLFFYGWLLGIPALFFIWSKIVIHDFFYKREKDTNPLSSKPFWHAFILNGLMLALFLVSAIRVGLDSISMEALTEISIFSPAVYGYVGFGTSLVFLLLRNYEYRKKYKK